MAYIKGSELDRARAGSYEARAADVSDMISNKYIDEPFSVVATFEDRVLVLVGESNIREIKYSMDDDGKLIISEDKVSRDLNIIDEEDTEPYVANEMRRIVGTIMEGGEVSRTQVRELVPLVNNDSVYWLSDVLSQLDESMDKSEWYKMYRANQEKIRTSMYGKIREIESNIPKERYGNISVEKINKFESEIAESIGIVKNVFDKSYGDCVDLVFGEDKEYLGAVCESMKAEAQAVVGLLGKAEKLYRQEDLSKLAKAHDQLAERAKHMAVVAEYLFTKAKAQ